MNPAQITLAEDALIKLDPILGELIKRQRPIHHQYRGGYFASLCRSIIGQQVSVASAAAIFARLETVTQLDPEIIARLQEPNTKTIGLSKQKTAYLRDLAAHFVANPAVYDHLGEASDEEVITELTAIKGIGKWTAQMFLMFTLGRPDVFAPDDIGLIRAMQKLYDWPTALPQHEIEALATRWAPYRTVASWHLWESLKNNPL